MSDRERKKSTGKREAIEKVLQGDHALIHLFTKVPGVEVPEELKKPEFTCLKISYLFRGSLELAEEAIVTELLFKAGYYTCTIPYAAVWACTDEKGKTLLWPESVPPHLAKELMQSASLSVATKEAEPAMTEPADIQPKQEKGKSSAKRPLLRRVK